MYNHSAYKRGMDLGKTAGQERLIMVRKGQSKGQLSHSRYSKRQWLVSKGRASWIPLYKFTVKEAIEAAGLP
jgi:hypothetical protein